MPKAVEIKSSNIPILIFILWKGIEQIKDFGVGMFL